MPSLLTLDPGGTTGWAFGRYDNSTAYENTLHGMIPGGLDGFLAWWDEWIAGSEIRASPDEVVSENFTLRGKVVFPDVTPLRIEGALSVLWPRVIYQTPADKIHASDTVLQRYGLWFPGDGHDRDAARHALAYLKLKDHKPTIRKMGLNDAARLCRNCYGKLDNNWCNRCGGTNLYP